MLKGITLEPRLNAYIDSTVSTAAKALHENRPTDPYVTIVS